MINFNKDLKKEDISEKEGDPAERISSDLEDKNLKEKLENEVEKKIKKHRDLFERYDGRLKDLDSELITPEDEIALKEAFMHAKEVFKPEELVSWFRTKAEPFYRAGSWELLLPLYEELLEIVKKKPGPDSQETAAVLVGLGGVYRYRGNYENALKLFSRALKIYENLPAGSQPEIGDTLSELGFLYYLMDRHE
ncbi:MAG: tetratricopeptide repeat protein, partial [Desulfitobacteriaceae bacterium]|nr:tetratricopeptide repeat protein [Desulfitobacteriaceae bacterium]